MNNDKTMSKPIVTDPEADRSTEVRDAQRSAHNARVAGEPDTARNLKHGTNPSAAATDAKVSEPIPAQEEANVDLPFSPAPLGGVEGSNFKGGVHGVEQFDVNETNTRPDVGRDVPENASDAADARNESTKE